MKNLVKYVAGFGLVASLGLIGAPEALAKAHDQGVGDGDRIPGTSQAGGAGVGGPGGVSPVVKDGQRGDGASAAGSDNSGDHGLGQGGVTPDN